MNHLSARRRGRYLHHTQQTKQTNIHALSGIRNLAPSNQSTACICLRPQDERNRLYYICFDYLIRNAVSLWRKRWRTEDRFIVLIHGIDCDMGQCLLGFRGPIGLHAVTTEHHNPNTHSRVNVKSTEHKLFALSCRKRSLCFVDRKGEVTLNQSNKNRTANTVFRDRAHRRH
jgi:hypothetical protein